MVTKRTSTGGHLHFFFQHVFISWVKPSYSWFSTFLSYFILITRLFVSKKWRSNSFNRTNQKIDVNPWFLWQPREPLQVVIPFAFRCSTFFSVMIKTSLLIFFHFSSFNFRLFLFNSYLKIWSSNFVFIKTRHLSFPLVLSQCLFWKQELQIFQLFPVLDRLPLLPGQWLSFSFPCILFIVFTEKM